MVLGSVRAQLRGLAVRRACFRNDSDLLGSPSGDLVPEFCRVRWGWLLAEYARRVLADPGAVRRAIALAGDGPEPRTSWRRRPPGETRRVARTLIARKVTSAVTYEHKAEAKEAILRSLYRSNLRPWLRCSPLRIFLGSVTHPRRGEVEGDGWPDVLGAGWALVPALMRPVLVVVSLAGPGGRC